MDDLPRDRGSGCGPGSLRELARIAERICQKGGILPFLFVLWVLIIFSIMLSVGPAILVFLLFQ